MRKEAYKMPYETKKMFKVDLQLFNDGGATGGAESSAATTEDAPKTDIKPSGSSRRSKKGEFDNVVFGKQEGTTSTEATSLDTEGNPTGAGETDVTVTSNTLEERKKAYNDLINGEYKDIDQKRFQEVFDRRFKEVKGMEAELAEHKEVVEVLAKRYGNDDVKALKKTLMEDYAFWEQGAEANGQTVEQYIAKIKQDIAMSRLERENTELRAIRQREIGQQQFQQQIDKWHQEADKVKELYPSFDLKSEVKNKEFMDMLKRGIPVQHAYEIVHMDEIKQNAARAAAQTADAQAQARIKQKASRPSENGISSQSAAIVKDNVANLTRRERAEIAKRVARGETIRF